MIKFICASNAANFDAYSVTPPRPKDNNSHGHAPEELGDKAGLLSADRER